MRIIAGSARGRKLVSPGRTGGRGAIRPTADRAREALFSILGPTVNGAQVLDLFAGTGALALEALSRGAQNALLVDDGPTALQLIRRNIELCGFEDQTNVLKMDLKRFSSLPHSMVPQDGFSLVFIDPPYRKNLGEKVFRHLVEGEYLHPEVTVILEDEAGEDIPVQFGPLEQFDFRSYGETGFWLFSK